MLELTSRTRIFHDIDAELDDVTRADLMRTALLRRLAQALVVHERAIAALRVLQVILQRETSASDDWIPLQ